MANQILVDNFPGGRSIESAVETFRGSIALCGSAVSTGEPLNWADMVSGVGYNEVNRLGNGGNGSGNALVTALSASTGTITATAANNFQVGQLVTFVACTSTLGLLLNGLTFQIVTASSSQFTFLSASTGSGSGETGMAVNANNLLFPLQGANKSLAATVTALSASGGIVTVTATNSYLPGAQVVITSTSSGIGASISGQTLTVLQSTGSAFTVTSAATGATGTGTASGINPPQPFEVQVWSELASGYIYQYSRTTGVLYVFESASFTPAGTNSSATPPIFTGTPVPAAPFSKLAAAAYPSGVLNDLIRYKATFQKA
jgi:hypothetical protein